MAFQPPAAQDLQYEPDRSTSPFPPRPPPAHYARQNSNYTATAYEDIKLSSPLLSPSRTSGQPPHPHDQEPDLEKLSPGYQHRRGWKEKCGVGMRCAAGVLGMAVFVGVIYFVSVKVWSDGQREGE